MADNPYSPPVTSEPHESLSPPVRKKKTSRRSWLAIALSLMIVVPAAPLVGMVLGILSLVKEPPEQYRKDLAVHSLIVGAVFVLIQLFLFIPLVAGWIRS